MKVSRYTPSLLAPEDLEAIFVQRYQLAKRLVEQIRASALTDSKQFNLLIGPRGIGKTHLISILYHRVTQQEDLKSHLVIAWLREEEWGIGSFFDLVLRILNALQAKYQEDDLASKISNLYDLSPEEAEQVALSILKNFIGERTLLLLMENLEDVFAGLGDIGQKQLRSFLQEQGCCTIVATSQSLFNGVKLQTSPFYGFFRIQYLKDFSVDEAVSLLTKIAQQEEDSELVEFLRTSKGRSRVQAVHHLAGGNPRIYVVFSEFLTHESLDELIQPFMNMLDDLTPYYQARMMYLSPQQRKIIEVLSRRKYAMPVKEIAQRCFVTHQTVSGQLKDLRDKGYVFADSIGRQSFHELREPLMRICLSVKETRGEPVRLIVDFLKAWYPRSELQGMQHLLGGENIRDAEAPARLAESGYQQPGKANSRYSSSLTNDTYLALALVENEEEELDPRIAACIQECNQQHKQQNLEGALSAAKKLVKLRGREIDHHWQGFFQSNLCQYEEALASYDKVLEIKPDDDRAWYDRGVTLGGLGRYEEAIRSYDKALKIKPDKDEAWYNRGVNLGYLGRYEEAISSYDKALGIKPDDEQAWCCRGIDLDKLGRHEEAIFSYDKALKIKPDDEQAWNNQGVSLVDLERYDKAISNFDKALEFKQDDNRIWYNRGFTLDKLGRYEEAISSYEKALEIKPDDELAWNNRGFTLDKLGRYEEAISSYEKALEIKPDDELAWNNRVDSLKKLERYEEVISSYEKALEIKPDREEIWNNRGVTLGKMGRHKEAITSFDKALELKPDNDSAWNNRGISLGSIGRYEEAITSFDEALKINLNKPFRLLYRAGVVFASNPNDKAYKILENMLSQLKETEEPNAWPVGIMLQSLFQRNQDIQKWQFHIRKLISLFKGYGFLDVLGIGLFKSSNVLLSEMVSQSVVQAWFDVWMEEAKGYEEFRIPLRLLKATVHYKETPDDPRVFLQLPTEERTILKQALGLETG